MWGYSLYVYLELRRIKIIKLLQEKKWASTKKKERILLIICSFTWNYFWNENIFIHDNLFVYCSTDISRSAFNHCSGFPTWAPLMMASLKEDWNLQAHLLLDWQ